MTRRRKTILVSAVAVSAIVLGLILASRHSPDTQPSAGRSSGRQPYPASPTTTAPSVTMPRSLIATATTDSPSPSVGALNYGDPQVVAAAYVAAAESLDWHWLTAAGYLPAVQPLSTAEHWTRDLQPLLDSPSGATFRDAQAAHVIWTVTISDSTLELAAPHSSTDCWVRVNYAVTLNADSGRPGGVPNTGTLNVAMQVVDGKWLVAATSSEGG